MRIIKRHAQTNDWDDLQDNLVKTWYYVSKIMSTIINKEFPYYTFEALLEQVLKDPSETKQEGDKN